MATAGTLEYLISIDSSKVSSGLSSAESKVKGFGNKLNAWTVAKGQLIANFAEKAVTATTKAFSSVIKGSVNAFKDYEQLVGGVDTLFKESSQKVQIYAEKAFKTAGISANDYMETVTAFSASLLQSLGGDTSKAADVADMAIQDMADNANKMGTSMESIQNAYQGFAKQNYTMLDNLKLGYGGTKKEMERLLEDASKLTGKDYDISNLADVFEAIHAIQEELGITGTTKKEAESTIEGSMKSAKAAWEDMLTAIGRGEKLSSSMLKFKQSAKTLISNLKPVIQRSIKSAFSVAQALLPEIRGVFETVLDTVKNVIFDNLPETVKDDLSQLKQAFQNGGVVGVLKSAADILKTKFTNALKSTKIKLAEALGFEDGSNASWLDIGKKILSNIKTALTTAASNLKIGIANLVGIEDTSNATWGDIATEILKRIKGGFAKADKTAKLKLANILGLTNEDGTPVEDGDQVSWNAIAGKAIENIKAGFATANSKAKVKLANLLGLTNEDGTAIDDGDQVSWEGLATKTLENIKAGFETANSKVKVTLANLLGLTNADGTAIEAGDQVSWNTIALSTLTKIRTAFQNASNTAKVNLANLLGLVNEDGSAIESGDDVAWSTIGSTLLEKIKTGIKTAASAAKLNIEELLGIDESSYANLSGLDRVLSEISDVWEKITNFIQEGALNIGTALFGEDGGKAFSEVIAGLAEHLPAILTAFATAAAVNNLIRFIDALKTMFSLPSVGIPAIIGAIAMLAVEVITHWDEIKDKLGEVAAWFNENLVQPITQGIQSIIDQITNLLIDMGILKGSDVGRGAVLGSGAVNDLMSRYAVTKTSKGQEQWTAMLQKELESAGFSNIDDILGQLDFSKSSDEMRDWLQSLGSADGSIQGLGDTSASTQGNIQTLGSAAANAAATLNSIQAPDWGDPAGGSHGFAKGLWSVPYNNYPALLHRGETVLTSSQARQYREGTKDINYDTLTESIISAIQSGMANATVRSYLSGKDVTSAVNKRTANILKSKRYATT